MWEWTDLVCRWVTKIKPNCLIEDITETSDSSSQVLADVSDRVLSYNKNNFGFSLANDKIKTKLGKVEIMWFVKNY